MSGDRSHRAALVEAFTSRPLGGNGAGVVLLQEPAREGWMQAVAASLAQSETAFLLEGPGGWSLRWFTPSCEVPLCGHATLAALLALGQWGLVQPDEAVHFQTRSGRLEARLAPESLKGSICLPSGSLTPGDVPPMLQRWLMERLGCAIEAYWSSSLGYQVALLPEQAPLADLRVNDADLRGPERRGLVLMQAMSPRTGQLPAGKAIDYQLRFFAPDLGIPEDPVTGSAHALVAPYWLDRLHQSRVRGWQCSSRGGDLLCERQSCAIIRLWGQGHVLWNGELNAGWPPGAAGSWTDWPGQA